MHKLREPASAARIARFIFWLLALLVAVNLLFLFLRANFGPAANWFGRTPEAVVESAAADGVASIELVREPARDAASKRHVYAADALCEFLSIDDSQQSAVAPLEVVQQRLAAVGADAQIARVEVETLRKHVVYFAGVSGQELEQGLRDALAQGLDAFMVRLENGMRVLALGLYDSELQAQKAMEEYASRTGQKLQRELALGLYREARAQRFLVLSPQVAPLLTPRLWQNLRADFPSLERTEKYCSSVAQQR